MSLRQVAEALRVAESVRVFVALDLIRHLAEQQISDLKDEALRTIEQEKPDKGRGCISRIAGVKEFLRTLELSAGSIMERQRGNVFDQQPESVENRIAEIGVRRRQRITRKSAPQPAAQKAGA